jgi:hypothetical protein
MREGENAILRRPYQEDGLLEVSQLGRRRQRETRRDAFEHLAHFTPYGGVGYYGTYIGVRHNAFELMFGQKSECIG